MIAATATTARAVVVLMSRSATAQFLSPRGHEQVPATVAGEKPFSQRERRDCLVAAPEPGAARHPPQVVEANNSDDLRAIDLQRHGVFAELDRHRSAAR